MSDFPHKILAVGCDFSKIDETKFQVWENDGFVGLEESEFYRISQSKNGIGGLNFCYKTLEQFLNICAEKNLSGWFNNKRYYDRTVGVLRSKKLTVELDSGEKITVDFTLQIKCRFDSEKKSFFLATMMLDGELERGEKVLRSDDSIFEILLFRIYCEQLKKAAQKGFYRTYVCSEHNDSRPRGTINIARHIKLNAGQNNGRIAYDTREHTAGNPLNRLVIAAYEHLKSKYTFVEREFLANPELSAAMNTLKQITGLPARNLGKLVSENLRPITHPYYSEYEELRKTCLKILRDEGVSIFDAESSEDTESLLMDVTKLWEKFLEKRIHRLLPNDHTFKAQDKRNMFFGKISEPDFVVYKDNIPVVILDAKFKIQWGEAFKDKNCSNGYLNEDIDKCIRDMVVFNTKYTGVIFPSKYNSGYEQDKIGRNQPDETPAFNMVCVKIPEVNSYDYNTWLRNLERNTEKTLKDWLIGTKVLTEKDIKTDTEKDTA